MRKLVGDHMKRSLDTAATCTTWIEADMSRVERARREVGLTALPFVARATIDALREYPALNAWLEGDQHTVHTDVNLGIAVSLGEDGLIVPVIQSRPGPLGRGAVQAHQGARPRGALARSCAPTTSRARTFTITNPGQFGSVMATPVINQPQVAILDLEAVVKRPVVVTDEDGNDSIAIRPMTRPRPVVGPPRPRRRAGRAVPGRGQAPDREPLARLDRQPLVVRDRAPSARSRWRGRGGAWPAR